jgi:phosphoglycerol transferase MdoB-like AlkP superfamily enzyme
VLLTIGGCWLVMIRGGVKAIPIQISDAYFSQKPILNDAAVNPAWNLVSDLTYFLSNQKNTIYTQLDNALAEQRIKELYHIEKDTTSVYFLSNKRPNIVFIILESWTAHCVKSFGGDNFATFTDSLAQQGIYFSNAYPAGHVSDQGIAAILSGQPVVSRMSVVNQTSKSSTLPSLNETLKPYGYSSGFYFGGDLNYGNIRGYLFNKKWDIIKEERDYSDDIPRGKLGIQDKEMASIFVDEINTAKQPFVYAWFTLSSHMPYDFEGEKKQLTEFENDYTNSIIYTDQALKLFFEKAKKQAWYSNTLFVICADHSHANHKNYNNHEPMYHQIPMMFVGDVIKAQYRGYNYKAPSSQINIAKTLLHQMALRKDAKPYVWSQDMFNPYIKPFAYFCSFSFGGMVNPMGSVSFSLEGNFMPHNSIENQHQADSLLVTAKAFQQMVFKDYLER